MDNIPRLYDADTLSVFGLHAIISLSLVIAGIVLFPILVRRTEAWLPRIGITLACLVLFLFGLARLIVIGLALSNGPQAVVAPLEYKTQVNDSGRNGTIFESFVLAFYDKSKGSLDEISSVPPDDRPDRYIKAEVSEIAFALAKEGSCYEVTYYPLPRYVPMLLFFKTLDSDPFTTSLRNAEVSQCQ
jgi:hypothetical protein